MENTIKHQSMYNYSIAKSIYILYYRRKILYIGLVMKNSVAKQITPKKTSERAKDSQFSRTTI